MGGTGGVGGKFAKAVEHEKAKKVGKAGSNSKKFSEWKVGLEKKADDKFGKK
jgi:hypothetical protein